MFELVAWFIMSKTILEGLPTIALSTLHFITFHGKMRKFREI
jgi:hypothetical protein